MQLIVPARSRADGSFWVRVEPDRDNRWSKLARMGHDVELLYYTNSKQSAVDRVRINGREYSAQDAGQRFKNDIEYAPPPHWRTGEVIVL